MSTMEAIEDDQPDENLPDGDAITVAVTLIARLAEDPLVPASYRVAARRHLKKLRRAA